MAQEGKKFVVTRTIAVSGQQIPIFIRIVQLMQFSTNTLLALSTASLPEVLHPPLTKRAPRSAASMAVAVDDFRQFEDGEEHADDHAAHHYSEENDQDWLD